MLQLQVTKNWDGFSLEKPCGLSFDFGKPKAWDSSDLGLF